MPARRTTDQYRMMLEALDTEIGRLLESVDPAQTNIIVIGDNGTPGEVVQAPYGSGHAKGSIYNGGTHVPMVAKGPAVTVALGSTADAPVHCIELFSSILELACLARDLALGGGYSDPPGGGFDTVYIELPTFGVTPPVPNLTRPLGAPIPVVSVTVDGAPATVAGRYGPGLSLGDEDDDSEQRYRQGTQSHLPARPAEISEGTKSV